MESISISRIKTFQRCPLQYYYRYIRNIVSPINVSLIAGKSTHYSLQENFKHKEKEKKDLKIDDVLDIFSTHYENSFINSQEPIDMPDKNEKPEIKDKTINVIKLYHSKKCKKIVPKEKFVERWFELSFENVPYTLKGIIDLVDESDRIIDYKLSGRKPNPQDYETDPQLLVYGTGYKALTGKYPSKLEYHFLIRTKEANIQNISFEPSEQRYIVILKLVGRIAEAIKTGIFYPVKSVYTCSWCGYKDRCDTGDY